MRQPKILREIPKNGLRRRKTRDSILEYFIDRVVIYQDRIEVKLWYSDTRFKIELSNAEMLELNFIPDEFIDFAGLPA